jgi:hypothetical protein
LTRDASIAHDNKRPTKIGQPVSKAEKSKLMSEKAPAAKAYGAPVRTELRTPTLLK